MTLRGKFALGALVGLAAAVVGAAVGAWRGPRGGRGAPCAGRSARDAAGRLVAVPALPRRIVSLSAAATETVVALGLRARLVGVDRHSAA
ncbi:ABC transporter substrate-binding protein, partial [bacterium]|nr:ABC transporter substrate-binding protein [bacterium]